MGTGVSAGAAYNKLEKTDNEISKGLQYWGGITAQQIEGDKNRAAKKAEQDADRKERTDAAINKDIESKRFDFTSKDAGYNSLTENYSAFSRAAGEHHSELWSEYAKARQSGDMKTAYQLEDKMQKVQTAFKEQQGAADKFKTIYSQYEQMDKDGKLSDYEKSRWKTIKGFVKGDTKNVFLQYNKETGIGEWVSREYDADGNEVINKLSVSDVDNGRVAPLLKNELDGEKGMVNNYANLMGTYKKDYYSQNRDHSEEGYTAFAEQKLKETLFNDLDDGEVKDLSAQMFNTTSGLDDPKTVLEYKNKVVDELHKRVMMMEKTKDSSKLNLDAAKLEEEIRSNKAREAIARAKPQEKKDDVVSMAQRVSFDATQALGGDVSGMIGVIITSPDKKSKKTSTHVTDLGDSFTVKFTDGTTQKVPKTKQGVVNFIAQSDNLAGGRDNGLVEIAIREQPVPYDRPSARTTIGAGFSEGLDAIEKAGIGNDDKAAVILKGSLPKGWKVENANNGWINNELKIISPDGKETIIVDYKDDYSKKEAQNKLDQWEQDNNGGSTVVPEDAQKLRSQYNY